MRQLICCVAVGLSVLLGCSGVSIAQNSFKSETDQIKQAEKFFTTDQFSKALPLFSNIVSNRPDNSHYNYCYGVCIVEAGAEKDDAVRYLKLASTSPQTPSNVSLYLARALHAGGHFEEALVALEDFKNVSSRSDWSQSIAEELYGNCNTGIINRVPTSTTEHRILKSSEVNFDNFFNQYVFEDFQGKFLKLPKEYETKNSAGYQEADFLFISGDNKIMVLSRKDYKNDQGFDIWKARKQITGTFSEPAKMNSPVNSADYEAYATITNLGKTIYFSKKGQASIGGYDIFRSDLNTQTGQWSTPQNMGTPVNSPGNEYYYLPSADNTYCYFLTDRNSAQDKYQVVKASIRDLDNNATVINGKIDCKSCPAKMEVKITINSVSDNSLIQELKVLPSDPDYTIWLNAPEKYVFTVSAPGFPVYSDVVDLKKVLKSGYLQHIIITRTSSGKEEMRVITSESNNDMLVAQQANMNNDLLSTPSNLKSASKVNNEELIKSEENQDADSKLASKDNNEELITSEENQDADSKLASKDNNEELITSEENQDADSKLASKENNGQHQLAGIEITGNSEVSDQNSENQNSTESKMSVATTTESSTVGTSGKNPGESNEDQSSSYSNQNIADTDVKDLGIEEQSLPEINIDHENSTASATSSGDADKEFDQTASAELRRNVDQVNKAATGTIELLEVQDDAGIITGDFETSVVSNENINGVKDLDEKKSNSGTSEITSDGSQHKVADDSQITDVKNSGNVIEAPESNSVAELNSDVNTSTETSSKTSSKNSTNNLSSESQKESNETNRDNMNLLSSTESNGIDNTSGVDVITGEFSASEANIPDEEPVTTNTASSVPASKSVESNEASTDKNGNSEQQNTLDTPNSVALNKQAATSDHSNSDANTPVNGSEIDNTLLNEESVTEKETAPTKSRAEIENKQDDQKVLNEADGTSTDIDSENESISDNVNKASQPENITSSTTQNSISVSNQNEQQVDIVKKDEQSGTDVDRLNNIDQVSVSRSNGVSTNVDGSVVNGEFDAEIAALSADDVQQNDKIELIESTSEDLLATEAKNLDIESKSNSSLVTATDSEYMVTPAAKAAYPNIVFKVQVGAFQKSEAQKLVALYESKGLKLISNAVNDGITTVMTGSFNSYNEAKIQREKIRAEGYKDAFVVVYSENTRLIISDVLQLAVTE